MAIEAIPLSKHIGAEIRGVDLSKPVDAATRKQLYGEWLKHLVLLFRDQKLTPDQLVEASGTFGTVAKLVRPPEFRPPGSRPREQDGAGKARPRAEITRTRV